MCVYFFVWFGWKYGLIIVIFAVVVRCIRILDDEKWITSITKYVREVLKQEERKLHTFTRYSKKEFMERFSEYDESDVMKVIENLKNDVLRVDRNGDILVGPSASDFINNKN